MTPEQLYEGFQDDQAWLENTLSNMTAPEFTALDAYLFAKMDLTFDNDDGAKFAASKG